MNTLNVNILYHPHYRGDKVDYATTGSACFDLRAAIPLPINVHERHTTTIPTGVTMEIPKGHVGLIFSRSGLAIKHGLSLPNSVGVIDSDYRGEIQVALQAINGGKTIHPGERIAQMMIIPVPQVRLMEVFKLSETARGAGGFGSTGNS